MSEARPTSGGFTAASPLTAYWTDTNLRLTWEERKAAEGCAVLDSLTPRGVMLKFNGRTIAVRRTGDPFAPAPEETP